MSCQRSLKCGSSLLKWIQVKQSTTPFCKDVAVTDGNKTNFDQQMKHLCCNCIVLLIFPE